MSDSFLTLRNPGSSLFKDRGSKFYGFAFPVENETGIKEHLQQLKKEHPSARHHCYAWRLGADKTVFRANDDGEPSGTAGKPILGQIQSNDLTNVLIVVVRYFGGTLLGAGGLINAYRTAASEAIKNAGIEERFVMLEYQADFDVEDTSAVMRILKDTDSEIISISYEERSKILFRVKKLIADQLEKKFSELYKVKLSVALSG